ncbi:class I SAM-dependent DNA methyltransferase [Sphaerisporangium perillae]|uniref:class I SAM-dependent DNA methyltransferase n=1 Tax=Sphaerisporangium perillae TaxID=2935860 RepID=UPI00200EEFD7|nr:class I SAM-dependent DNA methyltransferase [Sphaerisporangium perillae]
MSFDSLVNRGDYFSAHYLAEVLPKDLKKKDGLLARWTEQEKAGRTTPRKGLRALGKPYFADRPFFADLDARLREGDQLTPDEQDELRKELGELHGDVLRALGFDPQPRELAIERGGKEYLVQVAYADQHLVAIECGWAADVDAALDDDLSGRLLAPVQLDNREQITSGVKLASWLLATDDPPRYVLLLAGGVVILADRATWGEGRYLAVSLDVALGRNNPAELETIAALFGADSLLPPEEGGSEPLADLLANSRNHAVGVSKELRDGLKESVELIANEVLGRIRAHDVRPEEVMEPGALAKELGREALRYLYRILFLLYAEARPELGILPTDDEDYTKGYSLARLGDLVVRDLSGEEARNSFHLYESLDLLFRMVNGGHRPRTGEETSETSEGEGLRFEPLRSDLFEPKAIKLIGRNAISLDEDDPDAPRIDTRLRNETLYKVLRKLMLTKGRRKERGGFISYAQLGINQLGAVYEGLMSYTGFIATEELYEVAKGGDPSGGSWMIPASKVDDYPSEVFVPAVDEDGHKTGEYVRYREGSFVYRLAGRDRETSASYYTPESLTQVTVQLALQHRLDQDETVTPAREILEWTICEPALGSGAFLNEAINQVAAEYLKRRQQELGVSIDPEAYEEELQKVKAYVALHNSYGVDLNETAIELAEVSVWLNVMHPGLQAPWFGLHLRRGNSLIGAGRRVYGTAQLTKGSWLKEAPEDLPFSAGELPSGKVHHFLLPAEGWGAVAGAKEARELAPEQAKKLATWRKQIHKNVSDKKKQGHKLTQLQRLQALSGRAEYLWDLVQQRLTISEREISRRIHVWGADWIEQPENAVPKEKVYDDLTAPGTPYWRLKKVMDAWCALWFWPLDKAGLLDGSDELYAGLAAETATNYGSGSVSPVVVQVTKQEDTPAETTKAIEESIGFGQVYVTESLFSIGDKQLDLADYALDANTAKAGGLAKPAIRKPRPTLEPLRETIPLATLDDWLDFAEAVLGRADIPEDSLVASFASLADLEVYEDELQSWMAMDSEFKLDERFPWLGAVRDMADQQGFFHWELQFAQVLKRGGFDLQVGNPPWVRPTWDEGAVLAELEPWFKLADKPSVAEWRKRRVTMLGAETARRVFIAELSSPAGMAAFFGSSATYELLVGTQPDLYRAFMIRAWGNIGARGAAGLLHPDTHFIGDRERRLRAASYARLRVHADFVNAGNRFFPPPVNRSSHFGLHIYGRPQQIDFSHLSWLFHTGTLTGSLLLASVSSGDGAVPGVRYQGDWDIRPHAARVVRVEKPILETWRSITGDVDLPVEQTRLLYPVTSEEQEAIVALGSVQHRLGRLGPKISGGYHEKGAKEEGLIRWEVSEPRDWSEVVLKGPQFSVATPFFKQPPDTGTGARPQDLTLLPVDAVPGTNYRRATDVETYRAAQDDWDGQKYTDFYRVAWRKMIPSDTERSFFPALFPPGPAHIHGVFSMALTCNRSTALTSGFWAGLPIDYMVRIGSRANLEVSEAKILPAPEPDHPMAEMLLLRTLRLNCLTEAYRDLWSELYQDIWRADEWAVAWPGLRLLGDVDSEWERDTPLRAEQARRAALVEIDALVAVWLGLTAEQLVAIYRARFPILFDYEQEIYFDAGGRKVAQNWNTYGSGQTKDHYEQLMVHLDPEIDGPVPDGYTAPFYKADREAEYRQAHAVFSERLRQSGWQARVLPGGESAS